MRVVPVPCLSDNYAYLVISEADNVAALVDPGEAEPMIAAVAAEGVKLVAIWATHHHPDHVGGIAGVLKAFPGIEVVGHSSDRERIPGMTLPVGDGDVVPLGALRARIIHNPGHTLGAISYVVNDDGKDQEDSAIFTGDTLFGGGCGRVFEGTTTMMADSLARIAAEAPSTRVYFGHEYTVANLKFALAVDPEHQLTKIRADHAAELRAAGKPTTPSTIELELGTNPFLRAADPAVAAAARAQDPQLDNDDPVGVFAALRRWKNDF